MNNELKQKTLDKLAKELEKITSNVGTSKDQNNTSSMPEAQIQMMKQQATVLIRYIMKRCIESESLCEDVSQEHKTWERCMKYVFAEAKKYAKNTGSGQMACVPDETVYEWAEDYYRLDDKEAIEKEIADEKARQKKKEKEAAERKEREKQRKKKEAEKKTKQETLPRKDKTDGEPPIESITEVNRNSSPKVFQKLSVESENQLEGQMDIFSFL